MFCVGIDNSVFVKVKIEKKNIILLYPFHVFIRSSITGQTFWHKRRAILLSSLLFIDLLDLARSIHHQYSRN